MRVAPVQEICSDPTPLPRGGVLTTGQGVQKGGALELMSANGDASSSGKRVCLIRNFA